MLHLTKLYLYCTIIVTLINHVTKQGAKRDIMTELEELKARIKELEVENKKLKSDLKRKDKDLVKQIENYNKLNNSFIVQNADYIELEQLRSECTRLQEMADTWKSSMLREEKLHERTRKSYEILKKQYEVLQNQLQEQKEPTTIQQESNNNKQSYNSLEISEYFCISPQMKEADTKKAQTIIKNFEPKLKKVGITMHLTDENVLTCLLDQQKMKKIAIRNEKGAKRKLPKTGKPFGEYLTYDEVRQMIKEKTAEQVAQEFGFTKMTLYRKLKQAEQRADKTFK